MPLLTRIFRRHETSVLSPTVQMPMLSADNLSRARDRWHEINQAISDNPWNRPGRA